MLKRLIAPCLILFLLVSSCEDKKDKEFGSVVLKFDYQREIEVNSGAMIEDFEQTNSKLINKHTNDLLFDRENILDKRLNQKYSDIVDEEDISEEQRTILKTDVSLARITLGSSAPITLNLSSQNSYSKTNVPVGSIVIKVELLNNNSLVLYEESKSISIIENQTANASFNNWQVKNQLININSGNLDNQYTLGDIITVSWTNTHADRPVDVFLFQNTSTNIINQIRNLMKNFFTRKLFTNSACTSKHNFFRRNFFRTILILFLFFR